MPSEKIRRYGGLTALVAGGVVAGGVLAGTLTATAAETSTTPTPPGTASSPGAGGAAPSNPNPGDPGHPRPSDESLLTGDKLAKVKAAVLAEYPGATFVRVETDSDGVYEAHITTADGRPLTVELDASFAVTGEEQGGPMGGRGPGECDGDAPAAGESSSAT